MKKLGEFVKYFTFISTAELIVCGLGFMSYGRTDMPVATAWRILVSSALTAFVTILFLNDNSVTIKNIIPHYLSLCVIMSVMGSQFGWMALTVQGIAFMCVAVAAVYAFTYLAAYLTGRKDAAEINKALRERKHRAD